MSIMSDTIAAIATPPGRGGIGIIRISGQKALVIGEAITQSQLVPRQAHFTQFYDTKKNVLDEGVAIFFPGPHSFTGEDVVELQAHGSPVVLDLLLQNILASGARLAHPGEFSERAFLNDKIDLVQAEAISDLIDASSVAAAKSAVRSLQGEFSRQIAELVDALIYLRTFIEATLDFPEEDVEFVENAQVITQLTTIVGQLQNTLKIAESGVLLKEGITLLILGLPNAGKSSLLNALAKNEVAIVSEVPGTTRDLIKENIQIGGIPVHVIDTAGLRVSTDIIELEGVKRAKAMMQNADVVVWVVDANAVENIDAEYIENILEHHLPEIKNAIQALPFIVVVNKIDLIKIPANLSWIKLHFNSQEKMVSLVRLSARYAEGLHFLEEAILKIVGVEQAHEHQFIARRRHLEALMRAADYLQKGLRHYANHQALELLAEDCRLAQEALSEITGEFSSDDLLGQIFSSFCIGK